MEITFLCQNPSCIIYNWFSSLSDGDIISIIEIIVTASVGIWIGVLVQRNLTTTRSVKDFFLSENKEIKSRYGLFMNDLCKAKHNSKDIKAWFKIMTSRIDIFEKFLTQEYRIDPEISSNHNAIKQYITDTEEFNNYYKADHISFTIETRNEAIKLHTNLCVALTGNAISINRAKQKSALRKKLSKK